MVGILAAVGTAVVTGLVSGAASEVGGSAAGWVLGEIFGSPDTSQADAIKDLGDQLDSIASAVDALTIQLADDMKLIEKELQAIKQGQLYINWEIRDNDLQQYISRLNVQYKTFLTYAANPESTSQQEVTNLVEEILDTNQGAKVVIAEINALLVGGGASSSKGRSAALVRNDRTADQEWQDVLLRGARNVFPVLCRVSICPAAGTVSGH